MMFWESWQIKKNFNILKIDHVAVATNDINQLKPILIDILGMKSCPKEHVENEQVNVLKFFLNSQDTAIELLEPSSDQSVIQKYLKIFITLFLLQYIYPLFHPFWCLLTY